MNTRSTRLRAELQKEIVDAAFEEFARRGYHQTKVADIAERLGIATGSFYLHFKSKREILDHVIDESVVRWMGAVGSENAPDAADTLEEFRDQVTRIGEEVAAQITADPRIARLLLFEATSIDQEMTARLEQLYEMGVSLTAAYLENGVRAGYLRGDLDTHACADALAGQTLGLVLRVLLTPLDEAERRHRHTEAIRLMLDGIAA